MIKWPYKEFSLEEVENLKKNTQDKNTLLNFNNLDKSFDTRWIGTACELAFKDFLDKHNLQYTYYTRSDRPDKLDFSFEGYNIDVKGVATKYEIEEDWGCNVSKHQFDKILSEGIINTFVFSRYNLDWNKAYIVGGISLFDFKNSAKFIPKGTTLNKMVANTDFLEVRIKDLIPVGDYFI